MPVAEIHDDEDDDYTPPVAVRVEHRLQICPSCSRAIADHGVLELMRCADTEVDDDVAVVPEVVDTPEVITTPEVVTDDEADAWPVVDEQRGMVVLPSRELDFEELAAALRTVIERERDEIVRRGGPLEKQNAELKERLAQALEDAGLWRRRAQAAAEARNTLQEQYDALVKANRKQRNVDRQRKETNHTRVLELKDLLDVAQRTPGFTVERTGGGHFTFKKNGVFVTDAASTGQGTKVNMATRVALRKAGLPV